MNSSASSVGPSLATTPVMGSLRVSKALLDPVLAKPQKIRNICILAHVDHGKTTLTDTLLASNGIISFKQAGKLRYLDSREDEQMRGITMEASAITLLYAHTAANGSKDRYAINLIDSPGHVDFSRQVVTAARLVDGCLVLIDAVEGVCTQTLAVLRQAKRERLKACLVVNKVDRLITELKLSTADASIWLQRLLEQVNAARAVSRVNADEEDGNNSEYEYDDDDDESNCQDDDADGGNNGNASSSTFPNQKNLFRDTPFNPIEGNVIFCSSTDGWAFTIDKFVKLYSEKLEMNPEKLKKALWGEYYFDAKNKRVIGRKTAEKEDISKTMLAQFVLDPIWSVYEASVLNWNEAKIQKIANGTGAKLSARELKNCDGKGVLKSIMGQWLPLAETTFNVIIKNCPSPLEANILRLDSIIKHKKRLAPAAQNVVEKLSSPAHPQDEPVVAFVSKFFSVTTQVPYSSSSRTSSCEDLRENTTIISKDAGLTMNPTASNVIIIDPIMATSAKLQQFSLDANPHGKREKLIGMARCFHGTIKKGQQLYLLSSKHIPEERPLGRLIEISELYLLMGRDLEPVDTVHAGSVFGIGGLESFLDKEENTKTVTLSSTLDCPCLAPPKGEVVPIVHVAVRPAQLGHFSDVVAGLKLLCQADPCAETFLEEESGEYILETAGELHLEQCLKDLKERFTPPGIDLVISPPIVPYRETIDKEKNRNTEVWKVHIGFDDSVREQDGLIRLSDGRCKISARATFIPSNILNFIISSRSLLKEAFLTTTTTTTAGSVNKNQKKLLYEQLDQLIASSSWAGMFTASQIWTIGPRRDATNLLICTSSGTNNNSNDSLDGKSFYQPDGLIKKFQSSILTAFQLITDKGPLAREPLMGVAFIIENIELIDTGLDDEANLTLAQLIPLCKTLFETAFLFWSPRLMLAIYRCSVQTTAEMLGRVYSIISKRHGKVVSEEYHEGTGLFTITARLSVVESFGLADDLRGKTAGVAIPQLLFSGYDVLPEDPFWVPTTEDELIEYGSKYGGTETCAMKYLINIRERKGLFVEKKIVQFAEKQRTLKK